MISIGYTLIFNILAHRVVDGPMPLSDTQGWGLYFGPTHNYFPAISTVLLGPRWVQKGPVWIFKMLVVRGEICVGIQELLGV